jgi:hypothetical protein
MLSHVYINDQCEVDGPIESSSATLKGKIQDLIISIVECPGLRGPGWTVLKEGRVPPPEIPLTSKLDESPKVGRKLSMCACHPVLGCKQREMDCPQCQIEANPQQCLEGHSSSSML